MKKVISLAVFGDPFKDERAAWYWQYLPVVIRGYRALFPEWEIWIHHDSSILRAHYGAALFGLERLGIVRLFLETHEELCKSMLWRMKPLWNAQTKYVLCRDVDHTPMGRERQAVDEFISSGFLLHSIRDNPSHCIPMLGGLIGFDAEQFRDKFKAVKTWAQWIAQANQPFDKHGDDQSFLVGTIWPHANASSLSHCRSSLKSLGDGETRFCLTAHCPSTVDAKLWRDSNDLANFIGTPSVDRDLAAQTYYSADTDRIDLAERHTYTFHGTKSFSYLERQRAHLNPRKVLLSATTGQYAHFLPLVCHAWQRMGYSPVVQLVGGQGEWDVQRLKRIRLAGAEIFFIPRIEGINDSTVAQVSRLYGWQLRYPDDTYMLTADADMLPLGRDWFNQGDGSAVQLYYANAYQRRYFPLCYIGATVEVWRDIMGSLTMAEQMVGDLGLEAENWTQWNYDEQLCGRKVNLWPGHPDRCQMIDRQGAPPNDRIDRSCWKYNGIAGMVDAHMLRPLKENYETMEPMFRDFFGSDYERLKPDFVG
jgi:hypothetical protein